MIRALQRLVLPVPWDSSINTTQWQQIITLGRHLYSKCSGQLTLVKTQSGPGPCLVFGSNTGITLKGKLHKTSNTLATAPINTAANLLASGLAMDMLGLQASSRGSQGDCLIGNLTEAGYALSHKTQLVNYAVLFTTLVSAEKLVTVISTNNHLPLVFIDEVN